MNEPFFSIIVPAHNEAEYIGETLRALASLEYPQDRFEALVIENGSTDETLVRAKKYESHTIRVHSIHHKGVSIARNYGIDNLHANSDWVIFLDADTILEPNFLRALGDFLKVDAKPARSIGTVAMKPSRSTWYTRAWFGFYNISHKLTRTSFALFIVRKDVLTKVRFDERHAMAEDLRLIKDAQQYGAFFYFAPKLVTTSTRRFDQEGWWRVLIHWLFVANISARHQRKFGYKVIR